MAQQSKTALTSRPLTKALGTASILGLAIAGANMANAIQTDFGVDFQSSAFAVDSDAYEAAGRDSATDTGFANLLRVKADFKHEGTGVSVHTRTELAGDRWTGDGGRNTPAGGTGGGGGITGAYNNGNLGSNVRLDLGYVQVPFANGTILRVGRQEANWSNCFLVCDDRRDRIITITPTSLGTVIVGYDRRQDSTSFRNPDNGDMVNAGLVTRLGGFTTGLLYVYWMENSDGAPGGQYALQGTHLFSPYISGKLGDAVTLTAGLNYFDGNAIDFGNGQIFADAATSEYVRLGTNLGAIQLNAQWVGTQDGGLVSPGFDTYSSLVNNNPESTANPTSVIRMGGASGLEDYEENLFIAKAGFNVSPQLMIHGSIGTLMIDTGTADDDSMVYDLGASYKINDAVTTSATWGMVTKSDVLATAGNSLIAGSQGVSLANDDIMAASINLDVKF
ncbi:hypothetical protein SAMN05216203_3062 [Marinobacter daqiaonensis]|uniref:Porin n=1 Tax=Marinobacter daqiaonensis TaxID=650891 RepID=A0A1I6JMR8_9GAMM|nr:hypothetical protein [Marinobacter daqiaonensis]SFR80272.1 hypothetical protein SAMN05216203_3062 [Marinobacter daqiaonensis]